MCCGVLSMSHLQTTVRALKKQEPDLLLVSSKDGRRLLGYRSILCLHSPVLSQVLAKQEQVEVVTVVSLPVSGEELEAVIR
jgi:hypothetical protein